jgi:HD-GYP domain-containing protein (c-di-GMP phosphodiesterase class II)
VSYCGLPLLAKGRVGGVLELFTRSPLEPSDAWWETARSFAAQAAVAMDSANLFVELERTNLELVQAYDATLEGWAKAHDLRDHETVGHSKRVAEMTLQLANALNVPGKDLVHFYRGALLHDIGKLAIPDSILRKPGKLDEREWKEMRRHPAFAYELLKGIGYLVPSLDIPRYHHEHWDGSGYPDGLSREGIPLAARIFAVVDVWDALTSDRPYREAWPRDRVIGYLEDRRGTQFDPQVVDAFLGIVDEIDRHLD